MIGALTPGIKNKASNVPFVVAFDLDGVLADTQKAYQEMAQGVTWELSAVSPYQGRRYSPYGVLNKKRTAQLLSDISNAGGKIAIITAGTITEGQFIDWFDAAYPDIRRQNGDDLLVSFFSLHKYNPEDIDIPAWKVQCLNKILFDFGLTKERLLFIDDDRDNCKVADQQKFKVLCAENLVEEGNLSVAGNYLLLASRWVENRRILTVHQTSFSFYMTRVLAAMRPFCPMAIKFILGGVMMNVVVYLMESSRLRREPWGLFFSNTPVSSHSESTATADMAGPQ